MTYTAHRPEWDSTVDDICRRLDANTKAQFVLRDRTGIVPPKKWDEYHRLLDERKVIWAELSALLENLAEPP